MRRAGAALVAVALASLAGRALAGAELVVRSGAEEVRLDDAARAELAAEVAAFFVTCRPYEAVTRLRPEPAELERAWAAAERLAHARLVLSFDADAEPHLRGRRLDLLVGLAGSIPSPVLTRDADGALETYTKCSGLHALRLACRAHERLPGVASEADCERWRALEAELGDAPPS